MQINFLTGLTTCAASKPLVNLSLMYSAVYVGIFRGDFVDLLLGKVEIPALDFLKEEKRLSSIVAIL